MSASEITEDDVETVLRAHGVHGLEVAARASRLVEEESDRIIGALLTYTDMETQTASMLADIEEVLREAGIVRGATLFPQPDA